MTDYIIRDEALNASKIVYMEYIELDDEGYEEGNADDVPVVFKKDIEAIPAADVRPVVRGEWVDAVQGCGDSPHVRCSNCNEYYWRYFSKFRFCPHCGADMRDGVNENA